MRIVVALHCNKESRINFWRAIIRTANTTPIFGLKTKMRLTRKKNVLIGFALILLAENPIINAEVGGNGDRKVETGSTLTVELAPPTAGVVMSGVDSGSLGITQAIVSTRKQLVQGLKDEPKLEPRKVSLQFKFGVTKTGGATGQIKLVVVTIGGGKTMTGAETSTITLNFEKK